MTYNKEKLPQYVETAGKITIVTALSGVLVFAFIFIFNIGKTSLEKVEAANNGAATTTLTVLNTPPMWDAGYEGREEFGSSTTTPTNSGSDISWVGRATDTNGAPYFMLICSTNATPTPHASAGTLGTVPPTCNGGVQWAVSTSTLSGSPARAATTTTEVTPFAEQNNWFAWVCDDDPVNPRCNDQYYSTGTAATNSSPFYVNRRPVFSSFSNNGPVNPGGVLTFISSSSDPDVVTSPDHVYLIVCKNPTYSTTTNQCGAGDFLASTTIGVFNNANATYTLPAIVQDAAYNSYGYIYDEHGHSAIGATQGSNVTFTVNNVAPTASNISLNGGLDISLTNPAAETSGFTLSFTLTDNNSCDAVGGGNADEITNSVVSVFRSGVGTSTCNGSSGSYDPNNCYPSGVPTSVWNLACTASTTTCTAGGSDATEDFTCSFPLWFVADPTVAGTPRAAEYWAAGVAGVDNNNATGSMATSTSPVELLSLVAIDLLNQLIAYDQMEPGNFMANLTASTSLRAVGNTGIDQLLGGDSMCTTYNGVQTCPVSSTSTIPESNQHYATTSAAYASGFTLQPTSSPALLAIQIPKPTSTTTLTGVSMFRLQLHSQAHIRDVTPSQAPSQLRVLGKQITQHTHKTTTTVIPRWLLLFVDLFSIIVHNA
jgi:hypothetical protein